MNLSSSERAPASTWWRFKRCRRGALTSSKAGHSTQKCCSSSTCRVLHDLHILSSTGRPMYLPVSICSGAVPPLSRASRDLWDFTLTFCTYSSVFPYSVLRFTYNLNLGLDETSACHLSFSRRKRQQVTTCWSSLCESPSQELWCHQYCYKHLCLVTTLKFGSYY